MKKTSKPRKRPQSSVLEVRVISPRLAWLAFLKFLARTGRYAIYLAITGAAGWGIWKGIDHAFYKNPDFRLQSVTLNENSAIDEFGVFQIGRIDPEANLFNLDVGEIRSRLEKVPALSSVKVERQLPGTLAVQVTARTPCAWIASPESGIPAERKVGGLVVDGQGHAFPCTRHMFETAARLPIIFLPKNDGQEIASGIRILHKELARCDRLLEAAIASDPESPKWIESIRQVNDWSFELVTRDGVTATFGLGDHERQIANFRAAVDHASRKGYLIDTINLLPKINVPVTIRGEAAVPRAIPIEEASPAETRLDRRSRDLNTLLNSR